MIRHTHARALVALLLVLLPGLALAQPQVEVTGTTLTIGPRPTTPAGSSVRLEGLGTAGGTTIVFKTPTHDLIARPLATGDIPSVYTRRDIAEAISAEWTFNGNIRASSIRGTGNPFPIFNGSASKVRLQVYDDNLIRHEDPTSTNAYEEFHAGGVTGTYGSQWWRAGNIGGSYAIDMMPNGYGNATRGLSVEGLGASGTATSIHLGPTIESVYPGRQLFTDLGQYLWPYRTLHVGELRAATMVANETQAYTEASLKVGRGSTITRDITADPGYVYLATKTKFTRYGDWVILRGLGATGLPQFEVMFVNGGAVADCTGAITPLPDLCFGVDNDDYVVQVRRDEDGSGANAWYIGAAVVSMDRWIDIFSDASGTVAYGSAVLADRPAAYWNFEPNANLTNPPIPTPNRSRGPRGFTGATTTLAPMSWTDIGGCGFNACNERPPYGVWVMGARAGAQQALLATATSVPEVNTTAFDYAMSVEFVFHTGTVTPQTTYQPVSIWNYDAGTANVAVYHFGLDGSGTANTLCLYASIGAYWGGIAPCATVALNSWYHVVFTWDSYNGGRAYINGARVGTRTANPSPGQPRYNAQRWPLRITGHMESGESFGTHFGELALFDYALSDDQIAAHFAALNVSRASTSNGPTMVGWLGGGSNWYDMAPRWAAGNLIGLYDYPTETYGFAAGDYNKTWIASDAANGFRIMNGGTPKFTADIAGNINVYGGTINAGSVKSPPYWQLTPTGGYEIAQAAAFNTASAIRIVDTLGSANAKFTMWSSSTNATTYLVPGPNQYLNIGDDLVTSDGVVTGVKLTNNGTGTGKSWIDVSATGVQFGMSRETGTPEQSSTHSYVRPTMDANNSTGVGMNLGHPSFRWRNIYLNLPPALLQGGFTSGIVVLDPADKTRLAYTNWGLGVSGGYQTWMRNRTGTGECYIAFLWGIAYETNCL